MQLNYNSFLKNRQKWCIYEFVCFYEFLFYCYLYCPSFHVLIFSIDRNDCKNTLTYPYGKFTIQKSIFGISLAWGIFEDELDFWCFFNFWSFSGMPYDVSMEQALSHEEVRKRINQSVKQLQNSVDKFLAAILQSLHKIPWVLAITLVLFNPAAVKKVLSILMIFFLQKKL